MIKQLLNDIDLKNFLKTDTDKLLFVTSAFCKFCKKSEEILNKSQNTINACFDEVGYIDIISCAEFCDQYDVTGTPTFIIFDTYSDEISRLNYAADQDEFLDWITESIIYD